MGLYINMFVCFYCDAVWDEDPTRPKYFFFAEEWAVKTWAEQLQHLFFLRAASASPGEIVPLPQKSRDTLLQERLID